MENNTAGKWAWALLVIAIIIIIFVIAFCCCNRDAIVNYFTNLGPVTETFRDYPQPLVFPKEFISVPGGCKPYAGCFFPATNSNPISLRTGKRVPEEGTGKVYCEEAWRDCNAFQDCTNGKCVPKPGMYYYK